MKTILLILLQLFTSITVFCKIVVTNGLTHMFKGMPGEVIKGKIQVRNVGDKEDRIIIHKNDILTSCTDSYYFTNPNSHSRSLTSWMTTNVNEKILLPNEEYELLFEVVVPDDKALSGSYWGVLMIEVGAPISEKQQSGITIMNKARYAVQVIGEIGEEKGVNISFEKIDVKIVSDSTKSVNVKLKNDGECQVRPKVILDIMDVNSQKIATFESDFHRIFPNKCADYVILIKGIPKGKYEAILMADYGQDIYATNIDIDF